MDRAGKETFVEELKDRLGRAEAVFLTDFTGLNVKAITTLRQQLKDSGAEYVVVKNRLARRAMEGLEDVPDVTEFLTGPTGVVFGYEGVVEPAKALADFAKEHGDKPSFKIGILEKNILSPEEISRLAKLPPREALLSELAGALQAPMAALAGALEAKLLEFAGLIEALQQEKS